VSFAKEIAFIRDKLFVLFFLRYVYIKLIQKLHVALPKNIVIHFNLLCIKLWILLRFLLLLLFLIK